MEAVREELVTFEAFSDLDELTLQEVLVEMMREGSPGLILQQAPLSLRNRVRENLSSYNRDRLENDLRETATDAERSEAVDRTVAPLWVMQIRGDVKLKLVEGGTAGRQSVLSASGRQFRRRTCGSWPVVPSATRPACLMLSCRISGAWHFLPPCRRVWSPSSPAGTSTTSTSGHWRCCSSQSTMNC